MTAFPFTINVSTGAVAAVATLVVGGTSFIFDEATGTNQGTYTDWGRGGASQFACARTICTNTGLPNVNVIFQRDIAGAQGRRECIVELTNPFAATAADLVSGYTFTLTEGGATQFSLAVPPQPWGTSWRVASNNGGAWSLNNPRPVTRTVAQLQSVGLIPTYSGAGLSGAQTPVPAARSYASPFALAGYTAAMGTTGDRDDIGPFTGWQAYYMVTGNLLDTVLAQAEAIRSWPIVQRDPATGAPFDIIAYPNASKIAGNGNPLIHQTSYRYPYGTGAPVAWDAGHSPSASYLPFLMTGDPYYLESLQFAISADALASGHQYRYLGSGRYLAWPLRNAICALVATPASTPSWLLSKAQLQAVVSAYYGQISATMTASKIWSGLGVYLTSEKNPGVNTFAIWQNDYLTIIACYVVWLINGGWVSMPAATPQALAAGLIAGCMSRMTPGTWNLSNPSWYDSILNPVVSLTAPVAIGDPSITVDTTIGSATHGAIPGGGPTSPAPPSAVFPAPPFPLLIDSGHTVTVAAISGTTWRLAAPAPVAEPVGRIVGGPTPLTWPEQLPLQAAINSFSADTGKLAMVTGGGWTYFAILRCAVAMGLTAGVSGADPSWINAQLAYANTVIRTDYKWMIEPTAVSQ